jgi:hypothetical protein
MYRDDSQRARSARQIKAENVEAGFAGERGEQKKIPRSCSKKKQARKQ